MLKIERERKTVDGIIYRVKVDAKVIKVILTYHFLSRVKRWELELKQVVEAVIFPEEVVRGHGERFIAHRRKNEHLFRVIYEYKGKIAKVITVYYPYARR